MSKHGSKVAYGSHQIRSQSIARRYVEEQFRTKLKNARINLFIRRTESKSELLKKYGIEKYDLHPGYEFPESVRDLIPSNVPEYITPPGKNYVKQIVRALYYFKQCARTICFT